jgi:PST family polysaccharide transporter
MIAARTAAEVAVFAGSVALARLIAPAEFGYAAPALIVPLLGASLAFQGFGTILVKAEVPSHAHVRTATCLSLLAGLFLTVALWVTAPFWADPLFGERTTELLRLAAPSFLLASIGVVPRAFLQRELAFRKMSTYEVTGVVLGVVVSIAGAIAGWEANALIIGAVVQVGVEAVLLFIAARPPSPRFVAGPAREIFSFGLPASLSGLANTAQRNIDYVMLATVASPATVGYYWRAFKIGVGYQKKLSSIMLRLSFPLFSRARTEADLRALRGRVVRTNTVILFPLLSLLILLAPFVIPAVYGPAWDAAIVPTQILAVSGMALAVLSGTGALALARGHAGTLFRFNLAFLVATGAAVLLAAPSGLTAVCVAVSAVHVVMVAIAQVVIVARLSNFPIRDIVDDVLPAAVGSAALLAAGAALHPWLGGVDHLAEAAALAIVCGAVYVGVMRVAFASTWAEIVRTLRQAIPRRRSGRPIAAPGGSPAAVTRREGAKVANAPTR